MNHSLSHLQDIKKTIISLPREEQAQYADAVCVAMAYDRRFVCEQLNSIKDLDGCDYSVWNATSIGNIAYLLIHAPLESQERNSLETLLVNYEKWQSSLPRMSLSRNDSSCSIS